jgi:hypothetical protein
MPTVRVYGQKVKVSKKKAKQIKRSQRADNSALYTPGAILGGRALRNAATKLTDLTINPQVQAFDQQAASTKANGLALQGRTQSYYQQIAAQAQQGLARSQAINQAAAGQIAKAGEEAQSRITGVGATNEAELASDAQTRGPGLQAGQRAQEELAAMRANSAGATQNAAITSAITGQSQLNLQNNLIPITNLRGAEQYAQTGTRTQTALNDIGAKRAQVKASRGGTYLDQLLKLRQQGFENQVVTQGILGDQAKIQADVQKTKINARAKVKLAKMTFRQRKALQNDAQRAAAKLKAGYELTATDKKKLAQAKSRGLVDRNGKPKLSPSEVRQRRSENNKTATQISGAIGQAKALKREGLGRHKAAGVLLSGRGSSSAGTRDKQGGTTRSTVPAVPSYDQLFASVALDMAYDGHVSSRNLDLIKRRYPGLWKNLGLTGPGEAKKRTRPTKKQTHQVNQLLGGIFGIG